MSYLKLFVVLSQLQMDIKILLLSLLLCSYPIFLETRSIRSYATKNYKTKYGSIYDCVDFYKQPAFDHPSLKNHSLHPQMTPSFAPTSTRVLESSDQNATLFNDVGLDDGGCPLGTIPIKRYTDEDLAQIKEFTKDYASRIKANKIQPQPGSHFAIVQTNSDPSLVKYYGVKGTFNVYRLSTGPSQYSLGEIIIQNGEDRIQVGWMVSPLIYKDSDKHLFQYLNAGQSHCFNLQCPGFVVVDKGSPIGFRLIGESKRGGQQVGFTVNVYQDAKTGNWWLEFEGRQIGFWPRQIFSTLGSGATYIAVGGEAYGPVDQPLPPMGNGYYPVEDPKQSAFCYDLRVLNSDQQWINPEDTETFVNDDHYGVYDVPKQGKAERLVYYGGTTLWA